MNFYAFHIGDYAVHTRHLTLLEDLAYRRALDLYYTHECPLPADPKVVARMLNMRDHLEEVELVLREFFTQQDDSTWLSARCEGEIAKFQQVSERARANGRAGGRKRKELAVDPVLPPIDLVLPPADPVLPPGTQPVIPGLAKTTQPVPLANPESSDRQAPNPITNPITLPAVKKSRVVVDLSLLELPNGVPRAAWVAWVDYRKHRRLSTTELTAHAQLQNLAGWADMGHDAADIINTSIANGWQGLFEPKGHLPSAPMQSRAAQRCATLAGLTNPGGHHDAANDSDVIDVTARAAR